MLHHRRLGGHRAGVLKKWHAIVFWLGLVFDTTGTTVMGQIAKQNGGGGSGMHGVTGLLAIVLMLFHAVWATVGWSKKTRTDSRAFINSVFLSGSSGSFRMCWV